MQECVVRLATIISCIIIGGIVGFAAGWFFCAAVIAGKALDERGED